MPGLTRARRTLGIQGVRPSTTTPASRNRWYSAPRNLRYKCRAPGGLAARKRRRELLRHRSSRHTTRAPKIGDDGFLTPLNILAAGLAFSNFLVLKVPKNRLNKGPKTGALNIFSVTLFVFCVYLHFVRFYKAMSVG
jgi:hypothetical protein